jgi:hypothetical protein
VPIFYSVNRECFFKLLINLMSVNKSRSTKAGLFLGRETGCCCERETGPRKCPLYIWH